MAMVEYFRIFYLYMNIVFIFYKDLHLEILPHLIFGESAIS